MATHMVFVDGYPKGWWADRDVLTAAIEAGRAGVEIDPGTHILTGRWVPARGDGTCRFGVHRIVG